LNKLSQNKSFL